MKMAWNPGGTVPDSHSRIGPYQLERLLLQGAGYELWEAYRADGKLRGPAVAAIRLLTEPSDSHAVQKLRNEYQRLSLLAGAGVPASPALYEGRGALVMDMVRGVSLAEILERLSTGIMDASRGTIVDIVLRLAQTLRLAHGMEPAVVHGGLTPSSVFLAPNGDVLVLGWGGWNPPRWLYQPPADLADATTAGQALDLWSMGVIFAALLQPRVAGKVPLADVVERTLRRWPAAGRLLEDLLVVGATGRAPAIEGVIPELLSLSRKADSLADVPRLLRTFSATAASSEASATSSPGPPAAPSTPPTISGDSSHLRTSPGTRPPRSRPGPELSPPTAFPTIVAEDQQVPVSRSHKSPPNTAGSGQARRPSRGQVGTPAESMTGQVLHDGASTLPGPGGRLTSTPASDPALEPTEPLVLMNPRQESSPRKQPQQAAADNTASHDGHVSSPKGRGPIPIPSPVQEGEDRGRPPTRPDHSDPDDDITEKEHLLRFTTMEHIALVMLALVLVALVAYVARGCWAG